MKAYHEEPTQGASSLERTRFLYRNSTAYEFEACDSAPRRDHGRKSRILTLRKARPEAGYVELTMHLYGRRDRGGSR